MKKLILSILIIGTILLLSLFFYQNSQFKKTITNTVNSLNTNETYNVHIDYKYKFPNSTVAIFKLGVTGLDNKTDLPFEIEFKNNILNAVASIQTNFDEKTCACENFKLPINILFNKKEDIYNFSNLYLSTNQKNLNKQTNFGGVSLNNAIIDVIIQNYRSEYPETNIQSKLESLNINSNVNNFNFIVKGLENNTVVSVFRDEENKAKPYLKKERSTLEKMEVSGLSLGGEIENLSSSAKTEPYGDRIRGEYDLKISKIRLPISNHFKSLSILDEFNLNIDNDVNMDTHTQFLNFINVQSDKIIESPFFTTYILVDKLIEFNNGKKLLYNISSDSINDYSFHLKIETPKLSINNDNIKINPNDSYKLYFILYKDMIDDINKISKNNYLNSVIKTIENNNIGFVDEFGNLVINIESENNLMNIQTSQNNYIEKEINLKELKKVLYKANKEFIKNKN